MLGFSATDALLKSYGIKSSISQEEAGFLYHVAYNLAQSSSQILIVDVGTYHGYSAMVMGQALLDSECPKARLVTMDDYSWGTDCRSVISMLEQIGLSRVVDVWSGDDIELSKRLNENSINFIFFDSCHRYDHVYKQLNSYLSKVATGKSIRAVICGHDYFCSTRDRQDVVMAVEDWRAENCDVLVGWSILGSIWWTMKR